MKQFNDFIPSSALAELVNKYLEEGVVKHVNPRTPAFNPEDKQGWLSCRQFLPKNNHVHLAAVRKRKNRDRENKASESLQALIPTFIYK
jgi:hypothetical protein